MKLELIKEFIGDNKKEGKVFFYRVKGENIRTKISIY